MNPFYYAEVWHSNPRQVVGDILTLEQYQKCLKDGCTLWSFTGRVATICIVSKDKEMSRILALDFATMFMKGSYVTISVDLKNLTSTTTKGNPPPCY